MSILFNHLLVCSLMIRSRASTNLACFVGMQDDAFLLHDLRAMIFHHVYNHDFETPWL